MKERKKANSKAIVEKSAKAGLTEALVRGRPMKTPQFKSPTSWKEHAEIYRYCLELAADSKPKERNKLLSFFRTTPRSKGGRPKLSPEISYEELVKMVDQQIAIRKTLTGKKLSRKSIIAEWHGKPLAQLSVKESQELQTLANKLSLANTSSRKPK